MAIDSASSSLVRRTGLAASLRLAGNLANVLLGVGMGVILARLLPPREFGLFAVGLGIAGLAEICGSFGMLHALVQRKVLTREDESTAAILQTGGALLLAGGLVVSAPTIEALFGMPGLGPLVQLQSGVMVLHALGLIPNSRLTRRLAFDRLTLIDVTTRLIGGILSIVLAVRGMGALALAIGGLIAEVCRTGFVWLAAPGWVSISFRIESARNLLGYGTGILFDRIFNDLAYRLDVLIIGHRLGAEVVGLYQRANQLVRLPLYQFTGAVSTVLFPAMVSVREDESRFQRGYLGAVGMTSMLVFPLLTLLWTTADLLIPLLYGPMWTATVPLLTSLGLIGYLRVLNKPNGLIAQARGRVFAEAVCQAVFLVLTVLFVYLGSYFGIHGVIFGIGAASLLFLILMTKLALTIAGLTFQRWLGSLRTSVFGSVTMGVVVVGSKAVLSGHLLTPVLLLTLVACGGAVYMLSVRQLLTFQERQLLERFVPAVPLRFKNFFQFCIGTSRG